VLNDAYDKRDDMLTLISRAQLCAGVPIVEAELLFPYSTDAEARLFTTEDPWSYADRESLAATLERVAAAPFDHLSTQVSDDGYEVVTLQTLELGDGTIADLVDDEEIAAAAAAPRATLVSMTCSLRADDGSFVPGDEGFVIALQEPCTDLVSWVLRVRMRTPYVYDTEPTYHPGMYELFRRITQKLSRRDESNGPTCDMSTLEIPPLYSPEDFQRLDRIQPPAPPPGEDTDD
jgi:hypothetical protein